MRAAVPGRHLTLGDAVRIRIGEVVHEAQVLSQSAAQSAHTGRELVLLEVELQGRGGELFDTLVEAFQGECLVSEVEAGAEYVANLGSRSTMSDSRWTIAATLRQPENLVASRVDIADFSVTPTRYSEDADRGGIVAILRCKPDAELRSKIETLLCGDDDYFPVVRQSIDGAARTMRFGRCLWSSDGGGDAKYELVLVEKAVDDIEEKPHVGFGEPFEGNAALAIVELQLRLDALREMLVANGVVPPFVWADLVPRETVDDYKHRRQFARVKDLDDAKWN
jgi:hypothetical protein